MNSTDTDWDAHEQQPRHLVRVPESDDEGLELICPFGGSVYASTYPTVHDLIVFRNPERPLAFGDGDIFDEPTWPCELGTLHEGYCSMPAFTHHVFRFPCRGAVLEVQPVASGGCVVEYEAGQIGLEELLDEGNISYYIPGLYEVKFWTDGWGENFTCGLELVARVPIATVE